MPLPRSSAPLLRPLPPVPATTLAAVRELSQRAAAARSRAAGSAEWRTLWKELETALSPAGLRVRPINARDACAHAGLIDGCVGVNAEGSCLCYRDG